MNRINRNPWSMLEYAKLLDDSVEKIRDNLVQTRRQVEVFVDDLDSNSRQAADKFQETAGKIEVQLQEYERLSKMLRKNAESLIQLHSETHF